MKFVLVKLSPKISIEFCERVLGSLPSHWQGELVTDSRQLKEALADADYFMGFPVPVTFLKRNKQLKGIFLLSSQIPESYEQLNAEIKNITGINAKSVAQHGLYFTMKSLRERPLGLDPHYLNLGIMGLGAVGKATYNIHRDLFSQLHIMTRQQDLDYPCMSYDHIQKFLNRSDIIIITLAYNRETRELFSEEKFFNHLKKNVTLINIARGELFQEEDLVNFFKKNTNARYYTDVTVPEPYPLEGALRKLSNIKITDHQAGFFEGLWNEVYNRWVETQWIK